MRKNVKKVIAPLLAAAMALSCTVCVSAAEDETIKLTVWGAEEDQNLLKELTDKENDVYIPLLTAFINEINRQYQVHKDIPGKLVEYLLGKHDFYKIISIDKEQTTRIQSYNLHGTLNQNSESEQASIQIPVACLPTRIVSLGFVPEKTNTVELYMDGGWQFSFRIHNAETYVVPTLKFDIQIVGMPTAIITINCLWK